MVAKTTTANLKMLNFIISDFVNLIILMYSASSSLSAAKSDNFESRYVLPDLNHEKYAIQGDINLGALFSVTEYHRELVCGKQVHSDMWVLQYMEAISFAVQLINNDRKLLPNTSLGFVIIDYCRRSNVALAQSLSFLPMQVVNVSSNLVEPLNESFHETLDDEELHPSSHDASVQERYELINELSADSATTPAPTSKFEALPHYDVVGVLGPLSSTPTVAVSGLLSVAKIPLVSYMATTDELSSISDHPYFMRLVPPDRHQTLAMLTFIADNGWSYISIVYSDTSYGKNAFYNIIEISSNFGICVATSQSVNEKSNFDVVLENLLRYSKARVVILFTDTDLTLLLFASCSRAEVKGHFIWIVSDAISDKAVLRGQYLEIFHGAFSFMYYSTKVPQFESYFRKLRPGRTANPWFNDYWESYTRCSFKIGSCLSEKSVERFEELIVSSTVSLVIDSVFTFAHSINKLLSDVCSGRTGLAARDCVKGELLLKYMLQSSFNGFTGKIVFDQYGDLLGRYEIRQMIWGTNSLPDTDTNDRVNLLEAPIALFETFSHIIIYTGHSISWGHLNVHSRVVPLAFGATDRERPESVCSRPCAVGEFKIQLELPCCWECRKCRENEILVNMSTACRTCEKFTWPDESTNFTTCVVIPLSYGCVSITLTVTLVCLTAVAAVGQAVTAFSYVYFRHHQVIKAASRELSILQMIAIFVGYVTVTLIQIRPTNIICAVTYFMFCLSFTWLYAPMIVKAVRIYRIFINSSKCTRRPPFVSPQSQLIMAGMLIVIQVCLCVSTYILYRPSAQITQPVPTEKFVELSCDMTLPGLASFITYNLFLVSVCSVLAFKTRQLPDNFNESRFMSMCVSTTLVVWLAFIPTYFTASKEYVRVLLLSAALLINHTVALMFLFIPKVYAAVYVPTDIVAARRFQTNGSVFTHHLPTVSNRVAPANPV